MYWDSLVGSFCTQPSKSLGPPLSMEHWVGIKITADSTSSSCLL